MADEMTRRPERLGRGGFLPPGLPTRPLLIAMAAVGVLGAGGLLIWQFQQNEALRQQVKRSEGEKLGLLSQNESLLREVTTLRGSQQGVEEKLKSLNTQLRTLNDDLARTRTDLDESQRRYEEMKEARVLLSAQVDATTRERNDYRDRATKMEDGKLELERLAARLRERLALLTRDYDRLAEQVKQQETLPAAGYAAPSPAVVSVAGPGPASAFAPDRSARAPAASSTTGMVELPPIVVRKDQAAVSAPIRGRLVEVNESHRFVVVDQGSQDGVYAGMQFDVMRGTRKIGRATVVRVRPQLAACDIAPSGTSGSLQVGDLAVQRGP